MNRFSSLRAAWVMIGIATLLVALIGRVAFLQTYGRERTVEKAERQQHTRETLPARRGAIFDSTGMLMAGTVQTKALFIDPKFMQDQFQTEGHSLVEMDEAVSKLAKLIDKDSFQLSQMLGDRAESRFVKIAEHLDDGVVQQIEKLDLPGVGMIPENQRYYPMGSIAAHLLGGVGKDGGIEGLELKFEKQLAGKDGFKRTLKDFRGRPLAVAKEDYLPPQHGRHLILTIDGNIQMITEQELAVACEKNRGKRGEAIVMDPKTGEILALANWPTFNPQNLEDSKPETRRNRSLTDPYEPGSTIKPFIAGPAMQWNVTRPNEIWPVPASAKWQTPYGRTISDVHGYGNLAMWDVLVKSSNIGMSMLGERMGNPRLHQALIGFGFGRTTGIELPGEDPGQVHPLKKWTKYSTESIAQGYELMVTPMQLARAFCAYANGGRLIEPRIVRGVLDAEGNIVERNPPPNIRMLPQAIDPQTATGMKRILCDTMVRGTAKGARSAIWNIFGKTGTAHISEGASGYSATKFNSSFMGGAPAENPRLIVVVIVHEADKSIAHYGGTVSAPAATAIIERSLAYLQVPESPDLPPPPPGIANVLWEYDAKQYSKAYAAKTASARD